MKSEAPIEVTLNERQNIIIIFVSEFKCNLCSSSLLIYAMLSYCRCFTKERLANAIVCLFYRSETMARTVTLPEAAAAFRCVARRKMRSPTTSAGGPSTKTRGAFGARR
jgi:hypothetical protein